jgi:S-DNA-T family DNA segregation ATPase FtsK/SpoIIIE
LFAILLFAAAGLILISFGQQGELLTKLYSYLYEWLGAGIYLLPVNLIALGLLIIGSKTFLSKPNLSIGMGIATLAILGLGRSGKAGEKIWTQLADLLSPAGAGLIYLGALVIGVIIFFNTSLDQVFNMLGVLFSTVAGAFRNTDTAGRKDLKKEDKGEKKPLFAFDKLPLRVKGGSTDAAKGPQPSPAPVIKQAPKPAAQLGSDLIVNTPKTPGSTIWEYPPISLLSQGPGGKADRGDLKKSAAIIERTLDSFGIAARVVEVNLGPAVTQYALEIALGTKLSKITSLSNDMA